jgi:hypothetical protein
MNPLEMERKLVPLLGAEWARALRAIATQHKEGAEVKVSVPSGVLVRMAEILAGDGK